MKNHLNFRYAPTFIVDAPDASRRINRSLRFFIMCRAHYKHLNGYTNCLIRSIVMCQAHYELVTEHKSYKRLNACNAPDTLQMFVDASVHNEKITEI